MPTAQLDELLLDERKTTPIEIVSPKEPKEIDVRASGLAQLHARLIVGLGLLGGVAIGLVWLWA